ncbi:hypothetical protein UA3_02585 [Enterococcus faecium EnGen0263]|uniref:hypothetical protein n=1 Tax=Enterococcus faecium TaxID=1352 RepID=UPI00032E0641|nr:hypothetical protein [Enterococcus faecium]EOH52459.1 hypothetical protein UA3_02585 [Enterococcus faecium EnGen0263]
MTQTNRFKKLAAGTKKIGKTLVRGKRDENKKVEQIRSLYLFFIAVVVLILAIILECKTG